MLPKFRHMSIMIELVLPKFRHEHSDWFFKVVLPKFRHYEHNDRSLCCLNLGI